MQAAEHAFSNVIPVCFNRVRPGRFYSSQPLGKYWVARS